MRAWKMSNVDTVDMADVMQTVLDGGKIVPTTSVPDMIFGVPGLPTFSANFVEQTPVAWVNHGDAGHNVATPVTPNAAYYKQKVGAAVGETIVGFMLYSAAGAPVIFIQLDRTIDVLAGGNLKSLTFVPVLYFDFPSGSLSDRSSVLYSAN